MAKEFGDSTLYRAGAGLSDKPFQQLVPKLVEHTPLGRIPAIADSVRPVIDNAGNTVSHYVDPRSWTARGYEGLVGAKGLYTEGARLVTDDIQYGSEKFHESVDNARKAAGEFTERAARANPFG